MESHHIIGNFSTVVINYIFNFFGSYGCQFCVREWLFKYLMNIAYGVSYIWGFIYLFWVIDRYFVCKWYKIIIESIGDNLIIAAYFSISVY